MGREISWFDSLSADDRYFIRAYWETKDKMIAWERAQQPNPMDTLGAALKRK